LGDFWGEKVIFGDNGDLGDSGDKGAVARFDGGPGDNRKGLMSPELLESPERK